MSATSLSESAILSALPLRSALNVGGVVVHLRLVGGVLLSPVSGYTRIRRDLPACQGGCLWPRDRGLTGIVVMVGISSPPRV